MLCATVLRAMRRSLALCVVLTVGLSAAAVQAQADETSPYVTLEGRAVLPADTFAAGGASGFAAGSGIGGRKGPFEGQPVQGFSAVLKKWNGNYLVLADNGYGAKGNSADFRLRWYEVALDFGDGTVDVVGYTELTDPRGLVPFPIVNGELDRALTGADFDPESFRQAPDGTFWIGEEFGPYLLHVDAAGRLLEPPIPTPYPAALAPFARSRPFVQSPDNPEFASLNTDQRRAAANLGGSRGFEGMALSADGTRLYTLLEGALLDDPVKTRLLIQEFDIAQKRYTGYWFYPLSNAAHAIGDFTAVNDTEFLVIERDNEQGVAARFKRIYKIDLSRAGADSVAPKTLVADLMSITDRRDITEAEEGAVGLGNVFSFPFVTIEDVLPLDSRTLLVVNDNNYPFSNGRRPGRAADDNEFILIRLPEKLDLK